MLACGSRPVQKSYRIAALIGLAFSLFVSTAAGRIRGMSGPGCDGCHASDQTPPQVSLNLPTQAMPGERIPLRLTIQSSGIQAGGFFLSTESGEGTFEPGPGTKLAGAGLTHSTRKGASGGTVTLDFVWTAPNTPGATRFLVSALASNANGARSGDVARDIQADVAYGCEGVELYRDFDQDGFGNDGYKQLKCGLPAGFSENNLDCNDNNGEVYPGAVEQCNQRDDNCNMEVDEGTEQIVFYLDADGDGHGVPGQTEEFIGCAIREGLAPNADDCDDTEPLRYPGATELCNGVDDNCNPEADEGLLVSCGVGACERQTSSCFDLDCIPGLPTEEICNGIDDDCDGFIDDGLSLCGAGEVCGIDACIPDPNLAPPTGGAGGASSGGSGGAAGSSAGGMSSEAPDAGPAEAEPSTPSGMQDPKDAGSKPLEPDAAAGEADPEGGAPEDSKPEVRSSGSSSGCAVGSRPASGTPWSLFLLAVLALSVLGRRRSWRSLLSLLAALSVGAGCSNGEDGAIQRDCSAGGVGCDLGAEDETDASASAPGEDPSDNDAPGGSNNGPGSDAEPAPATDAGAEDGGADMCVDECSADTVPSCVEGEVRACWQILDQCAFWNESQCNLGRCADETACARCNDECELTGEAGCLNGVLGECVKDETNCQRWKASSACPSGFCGEGGACGTCQHECELSDPASCVEGKLTRCTTDEFGCRALSRESLCALGYCAGETSCPAGYSLGQRGSVVDDAFLELAIDPAGSTIAVGGNYDFADFDAEARTTDAYLSVKDSRDRTVLTERWGSPKNDLAVAVGSVAAGEYYVAGWTEGAMGRTLYKGGRDGFITRWVKDGTQPSEVLWTRQWGSSEHDLPRALSVSAGGDVVVFGSTLGALTGQPSLGGQDLMLGRWDAVGNRLWLHQWGTAGEDVGADVAFSKDGSIFVVGRTSGTLAGEANSGASDAFLQKLDPDGNVLFSRHWGGAAGDSAEALVLAPGGDLIVLGTTQGTFPDQTSAGGIDLHLSRWTQAGTQVWLKQWGTQADDRAYDVAIDAQGKIYAATSVRAGEVDCPLGQAWLVIWDPLGAPLHDNLWDTCEEDEFRAVAVDGTGRVTLAGSTQGAFVGEARGGSDAILVTYNPPTE